jgi:hypothetical protein
MHLAVPRIPATEPFMSYMDNPLMTPQVVEAALAWERRVDESPRAYEAFQLYLRSETRRLADVGAALTPACSAANVARWSSRHHWRSRSWEWDKEQDRIQQAQEARDRTAARKRHLAIAAEMQSVALHGLLELKAKIASGAPLNMSPGDVENMLTEAIKLERLTLGVEKDRRQYTKIEVIVAGYPDEEAYEDALRSGEPPRLEDGEPDANALPMDEEVN